MEKHSSKFHCAGVMSFDFGDDPIYKEFIDFITSIDVLKPAKVFSHGKNNGKVNKDVRISNQYKDKSRYKLSLTRAKRSNHYPLYKSLLLFYLG